MQIIQNESKYSALSQRAPVFRLLASVLGFVLILAAGIVTSAPAYADDNDPISVPDPVLRKAINFELGQSPNDPITEGQEKEVTLLQPSLQPQEVISDLTGMEYLKNLKYLGLEFHEIDDLAPLAELEHLINVTVSNNKISDLTPLQGLTNLETLNVNNNNISDLNPVSGLTSLVRLHLSRNHITDLTPLAALNNLQSVTAKDQFVRLSGKPVNAAVPSPLLDPGNQVLPLHSTDPGFLWFTGSNEWSFRIVVWDRTLTWERDNIPVGNGASFKFTGEIHHDVTFTDVPDTHSFYEDIMWMNWAKITRGYADGSFHPKNNITREATSAFIKRMDQKGFFN